jgi:hypothetical protein
MASVSEPVEYPERKEVSLNIVYGAAERKFTYIIKRFNGQEQDKVDSTARNPTEYRRAVVYLGTAKDMTGNEYKFESPEYVDTQLDSEIRDRLFMLISEYNTRNKDFLQQLRRFSEQAKQLARMLPAESQQSDDDTPSK